MKKHPINKTLPRHRGAWNPYEHNRTMAMRKEYRRLTRKMLTLSRLRERLTQQMEAQR